MSADMHPTAQVKLSSEGPELDTLERAVRRADHTIVMVADDVGGYSSMSVR